MRCKPEYKKENQKYGLWLIAGGAALAVLVIVPVRILVLLVGLALIVIGTLFVSKCACK